jgi:hypothetical protein
MSLPQKIEPVETLPADPAVSLLDRVLVAARDPNTDVDKLERLMGLYERMSAQQSRNAFDAAMSACQEELPIILRNKRNTQTNSNYADLAAIEDAAMPIVTKHGFSVKFMPEPSALEGHYGVGAVVSNSGHHEHYHADVPADGAGMKGTANKTATHAFASTMSYGRRILLCMAFNIATKDDDGNRAGGKSINADQFFELKQLVEEAQADEQKFCAFLGVEKLDDLPMAKLQGAVAKLRQKIAQNKAAAQ